MRNLIIIMATIIFLVVLGSVTWTVLSRNTTPPPSSDDAIPVQSEAEMTGTYTCLPHKDTSGPQTMECALGIETADGHFYALDTSMLNPDTAFNTVTGDQIEVRGFVTPVEQLATDDSLQKYNIIGVVKVTSLTGVDSNNTQEPETTSINGITFERPGDFGLAVTQDQVLVESVVPPCSETFDYCLYYNGSSYSDTNFESAGVSITERTDLSTESTCLDTQPAGYTGLTPVQRTADGYATSIFSPLQDSGAGHTSTGTLYRLAFDSHCYEFETRVGTAALGNFEPGSIEEFTEEDRQEIEEKLQNVVQKIHLTDREEEMLFP